MSAQLSPTVQELGSFLIDDTAPEGTMSMSELDGLLAGVATLPVPIPNAEWLPLVWGGDKAPKVENKETAVTADRLLGDYLGEVKAGLEAGHWQPLYDLGDNQKVVWEFWIAGFWKAVHLRPNAWTNLCSVEDDDVAYATYCLTRLYEFTSTPTWKIKPDDMDEDLLNLAPGLIARAVETLANKKSVTKDHISRNAAQAATKVGRNDPCPCGSGKKFKKCCGA